WLRFLTNAGSPDPVMTRHLCPALTAPAPSTAAGAAVVKTATKAAASAAPATTLLRWRARNRMQSVLSCGGPVSGFRQRFRRVSIRVDRGKSSRERKISGTERGICFGNPRNMLQSRRMASAPTLRPRVTIREIADLAGVSVATVSRVMNGRDVLSPEKRQILHTL